MKLSDLTPAAAKEWLIANDSEVASKFWRACSDKDLINAVKNNLRDFGYKNQSGKIIITKEYNVNYLKLFVIIYTVLVLVIMADTIYAIFKKPNPAPVVVAAAKTPTCLVQLRRENTMYEWRGVIK